MVRVAIIDRERCKPKDCGLPCVRFCPEVRNRVEAIKFVQGEEKPLIVEALCNGCGICTRKCPFRAIAIINLPEELEGECSHRYGPNAFELYRLPVPQQGTVTGLIGRNGTGKTTALRILSGEIVPNLGNYKSPPDWRTIVKHHRGSLLQDYFERLSRGKLRVVHKPQYVDVIPNLIKSKVSSILGKADQRGKLAQLTESLQLQEILSRQINVLSGGELQRVAIAAAICREADTYIFDEPSSHLDVSQRLRAAKTIRTLVEDGKTVVLAEHDLTMLDYLSDQICILYGEPAAYGIVSNVHGVRVGINIYLDGFVPDENMRFRSEPIKFHVRPPREGAPTQSWKTTWGAIRKKFGKFKLDVGPGEVRAGQVVGVLGPNGIGKTTFVRMLAGLEKPDEGEAPSVQGLSTSYKPQYISADYEGSVLELLKDVAGEVVHTENFLTQLVGPLGLSKFLDRGIRNLSGGELQRVAIASCLAKDAQLYLIDEPSAYLDVEERLAVSKAIRRVVEERQAFAFVVEHDIAAQDFVADRLMIFEGNPGVKGAARSPVTLREGMNNFLAAMGVTFRRDPANGRPRVNKPRSKVDRMQRERGEYYYA